MSAKAASRYAELSLPHSGTSSYVVVNTPLRTEAALTTRTALESNMVMFP